MDILGKQGMVIVAFIFGISAVFAGAFLSHTGDVSLPQVSMRGFSGRGVATKTVICRINANVGDDRILRMEIAIPYEDHEQRKNLKRNISRITSEFLMATNGTTMAGWVETRSFDAMRTELLKTVNRYADNPVKSLYFKSFSW